MSRNLRMYYYTLLGMAGGLIGAKIIDLIGFLEQPGVYVSDALLGAVLGLCIGFLIGLAEGVLSRSAVRGLRAGLIGGGIGMIAGALALPLGELVFLTIGGALPGRAIGWAIFGALIGLAESVTGRTQMWKGALGGLIGGAVGGTLLEAALSRLDSPLAGKLVGLILLGGAVGAFTALISVALSRAWLKVTTGKLAGSEFILDKFMGEKGPAAVVGSNVLKSDIALPDPDVAPQHFRLKGAGTHISLQDMSVGLGTFVNGRKVEMHRLSDGQTIRVGPTELVYHERR